MGKFGSWIFATLVTIPLLFAFGMWRALAAWYLWHWFAVPYLALPAVSYWAIFGLGLVTTMLWPSHNRSKGHEVDLKQFFIQALVQPPLAIAIGYVVRFWFIGG